MGKKEDEVEGRGKYTEGWTPGWTNDVVALNSPRRGGGCERVGWGRSLVKCTRRGYDGVDGYSAAPTPSSLCPLSLANSVARRTHDGVCFVADVRASYPFTAAQTPGVK